MQSVTIAFDNYRLVNDLLSKSHLLRLCKGASLLAHLVQAVCQIDWTASEESAVN